MRAAFAILTSLAALLTAVPAEAQFFDREVGALQVGLSAVPGGGAQVVYLQPRTVFTVEAAFYADVQAPFAEEATGRRFQAVGAVGGALRLLRIARIAAGGGGPRGNLDVGLRAGPGLRFRAEETPAERRERFRLLVDPFARYVRRAGGVRLFGEVGAARPRLRAGVWLAL